jgi:hypothetical protein
MSGYVAGWMFAASIACAALLVVMILDLAGARWFAPMRHSAQSAAATLPLFAVLLVPIAEQARDLYPTASDPSRPWMHPSALVVRTLLALALWTAFAEWSARAVPARRGRIAAAGVPAVAFTLSMLAFDWLMPLARGFSSDVYGLYVSAGAFQGAVGLVAVVARNARCGADALHALGRVMLVSVALWAYLAFFFFLLVWLPDLPREAGFFVVRMHGAWAVVSAVLVIGRFVVPFVLLLSRKLKRRAGVLAALGAWLGVMHALDIAWLVFPDHGAPRAADAAAFVAVVALAFAFGAWRANRTPRASSSELARARAYESR